MKSTATLTASLLAALLALTACAGTNATTATSGTRQEQVRQAGASVMPFDLDATKHSFEQTSGGGVQTVFALDQNDATQVSLVRGHLQEIRDQFSRGDFSDPAAIHGSDMPGLAELSKGASSITITYGDVPGGGALTYQTGDPKLVQALHVWFDAQMADHGADAMSGDMSGHSMSPEMWKLHHGGEASPSGQLTP